MPNATQNAHRFDPPGPDLFQAVFTAAFRDHVGTYDAEGKAITLSDLAREIGKKPRTIEAWRDGETVPRGADLLALQAVLPASFTNRLLALAGLGGAYEMSPEGIAFQEIAQGAANYTEMFIRHMDDGRVDHMEKAETMRWAQQMHNRLGRLLHAADCPDAPAGARDGHVFDLPKRAGA